MASRQHPNTISELDGHIFFSFFFSTVLLIQSVKVFPVVSAGLTWAYGGGEDFTGGRVYTL